MASIIFIILVALFLINFIIFYNGYQKYKGVPTDDKTGYDAALETLRKYKLDNYIIEQRGSFTDNYHYNKKVIKLSSLVFHDNNSYSVVMGYFMAMQAVLDKEKNSLFKFKKLLEPAYYFCITLSYFAIIMLAFSNLNIMYPVTLLGFSLIYQLVFLKNNIDIINRIKKDFKVDDESIKYLYFLDIAFGVIYIKVLIDKLIELIRNR